ncbi:hypothetical protein C0Q70_05256 [Pomacea canaliculata]|uniref:Uncharacterized protein n=1 Tax=Pomacea canaliculata TaxID=400727 RepID=A0A2T7PKR2_POMCA|nr:hypothetical protein C0Q70_05256 [Pomacea canaliculata]
MSDFFVENYMDTYDVMSIERHKYVHSSHSGKGPQSEKGGGDGGGGGGGGCGDFRGFGGGDPGPIQPEHNAFPTPTVSPLMAVTSAQVGSSSRFVHTQESSCLKITARGQVKVLVTSTFITFIWSAVSCRR